jgi:hypothetical protein
MVLSGIMSAKLLVPQVQLELRGLQVLLDLRVLSVQLVLQDLLEIQVQPDLRV